MDNFEEARLLQWRLSRVTATLGYVIDNPDSREFPKFRHHLQLFTPLARCLQDLTNILLEMELNFTYSPYHLSDDFTPNLRLGNNRNSIIGGMIESSFAAAQRLLNSIGNPYGDNHRANGHTYMTNISRINTLGQRLIRNKIILDYLVSLHLWKNTLMLILMLILCLC